MKALEVYPAWSCPYVEPWRTPFQGGWAAIIAHRDQSDTLRHGSRTENQRTLAAASFLLPLRLIPPEFPTVFITGAATSHDLMPLDIDAFRDAIAMPATHVATQKEEWLWRTLREMVEGRSGRVFVRRPETGLYFPKREWILVNEAEKAAEAEMWKHGPRPRSPRQKVTKT